VNKASDRLIGSTAAAALQLSFLAFLAGSVRVLTPLEPITREITLFLPRLQPQLPAEPAGGRVTSVPPVRVPSPLVAVPSPEALPGGAEISGLGQMLFGCAPEIYATLSPESRARCPKPGEGLPLNAPPNLLTTRSHVKNEALWAADLARKQSAPWAPCTTVLHSIGLPPSHAFDLKCLAPLFASGAIADPRQWQVYDQEEIAAADKRKLQQAYDEWRGQLTADFPPPPSAGRALPDRRSPPR